MHNNKALFLDRDGVINIDYGYVHKKQQFEFLDGIFDLTYYAQNKNYEIIVITNQAGIGKGHYSEKDFYIINSWMTDIFKKKGTLISKVYFCPNHPEGIGEYKKNDYRRKPNPGMLIDAKKEFFLDMSSCLFVGDQITDMVAGASAGVGCNILLDNKDNKLPESLDISFERVSCLSEVNAFLA